jgi:integrase/recombinase XerD
MQPSPTGMRLYDTQGHREVMEAAGIAGQQASPKGLRHGFGVACIEKGNLLQRWLGHAQL